MAMVFNYEGLRTYGKRKRKGKKLSYAEAKAAARPAKGKK